MVNLVKAKDSSYIHAVINFQVITVITYDCRAIIRLATDVLIEKYLRRLINLFCSQDCSSKFS